MKVPRQPEHQNVGGLLHVEVYVGAPVGQRPGGLLDLRDQAGLDVQDLRFLAEHGIDGKELLPDPLFHRTSDGCKLVPHVRGGGGAEPILAVHGPGGVVRGDRLPARQARDDHFIPPAVPAVGVSGTMPDHDRHVRLGHEPVALDTVAHGIGPEIAEIRRLDIMVDQAVGPEPIDDVLAEIPVPLFQGVLAVQPHAAEQSDVFDLAAPFEQLLHNQGDGHLAVAVRLHPALHAVGKPDNHFLRGAAHFPQRGEPERVFQGVLDGGVCVDFRGVHIGLPVTHDRCTVREFDGHLPVTIVEQNISHFLNSFPEYPLPTRMGPPRALFQPVKV